MKIICVMAICLLSFALPSFAEPPQPPFVVYGQILNNSSALPPGTQLSFTVSGRNYTTQVTSSPFEYSAYRLEIPATDLKSISADNLTVSLTQWGNTAVANRTATAPKRSGSLKAHFQV